VSTQYWSSLGAAPPRAITAQQFASLNSVPIDGTFLESAGAMYRVAGGAPLPISNPSLFGNPQPGTIDPWDIADVGSPEVHLNLYPRDGTVVEGLPSDTDWEFLGGRRRLTTASAAAVQVDDLGLAAFPAIPCVVPRLQRQTLPQVRRALQRADCSLGTVRVRRLTGGAHVRRVVRQTPGARTRHTTAYAVGVTLG
jgi:hypothetical protein